MCFCINFCRWNLKYSHHYTN